MGLDFRRCQLGAQHWSKKQIGCWEVGGKENDLESIVMLHKQIHGACSYLMLCVALVLSSQKNVADQQRFRERQQGCSEAWGACLVVPKAKAPGSSAGGRQQGRV